MANWWKDRDKWMPRWPYTNPPSKDQSEDEEPSRPGEDVGDVAHDDYDELDDRELPDRGPDS